MSDSPKRYNRAKINSKKERLKQEIKSREKTALSPRQEQVQHTQKKSKRPVQKPFPNKMLYLVDQVKQLLDQVLRFDSASDKIISQYFRSNPQLGSGDRQILAEAIYTVLRRKRVFEQYISHIPGHPNERMAILALYVTYGHEVSKHLSVEVNAGLATIDFSKVAGMRPAIQANISDPWFDFLQKTYGDSTLTMLEALNQSASMDLRVNTIKTNVKEVCQYLEQQGVEVEPCTWSPTGLRAKKKFALNLMDVFTQGGVEVQDEGSQLLIHLLAPKRNEMVVDFCAGAGGKTLAIGAMMRNTGRIYAFDVSEKRLSKLKPRLARSGLSNIQPMVLTTENDMKVKRLAGKIDKVFVDAPCSGMGTLRRNPDLKWRYQISDAERIVKLQASILASAARLVKPGGCLLYATCSILPMENSQIVDAFLAEHPDFVRQNPLEALASHQIELPESAQNDSGDLQLLPHLHQTDGFFASLLVRFQAETKVNATVDVDAAVDADTKTDVAAE